MKFEKGEKFCDFLFASHGDRALQKWVSSYWKEFAPEEQILPVRADPH